MLEFLNYHEISKSSFKEATPTHKLSLNLRFKWSLNPRTLDNFQFFIDDDFHIINAFNW